jgi:hypothetical protein
MKHIMFKVAQDTLEFDGGWSGDFGDLWW